MKCNITHKYGWLSHGEGEMTASNCPQSLQAGSSTSGAKQTSNGSGLQCT